MPTLDELEDSFHGGATAAQWAYALAHRAVAELAFTDRERGLTLFLTYWKETGSFERALRQAQARGELEPGKSPRQLSRALTNAMIGMAVTGRLEGRQSELRDIYQGTLGLLA